MAKPDNMNDLKGISGWLIPVAIGVVLLSITFGIIDTINHSLTGGTLAKAFEEFSGIINGPDRFDDLNME